MCLVAGRATDRALGRESEEATDTNSATTGKTLPEVSLTTLRLDHRHLVPAERLNPIDLKGSKVAHGKLAAGVLSATRTAVPRQFASLSHCRDLLVSADHGLDPQGTGERCATRVTSTILKHLGVGHHLKHGGQSRGAIQAPSK